MGCNIHMRVEVRRDGTWKKQETLPPRPCSWCNGTGKSHDDRPCYWDAAGASGRPESKSFLSFMDVLKQLDPDPRNVRIVFGFDS